MSWTGWAERLTVSGDERDADVLVQQTRVYTDMKTQPDRLRSGRWTLSR